VNRTERLCHGACADLGAERRWDEIGNLGDRAIHRGSHSASKYLAPDTGHLGIARLDRSTHVGGQRLWMRHGRRAAIIGDLTRYPHPLALGETTSEPRNRSKPDQLQLSVAVDLSRRLRGVQSDLESETTAAGKGSRPANQAFDDRVLAATELMNRGRSPLVVVSAR
jgi:hypothetical protein